MVVSAIASTPHREEQEEAASVLPCYDTGVLCARYGFW